MLSVAAVTLLAQTCAPDVAPQTLVALVRAESGLEPWAIGVNGAPAIAVRARTRDEAVAQAKALIAAGRSIDLGLGQINSRNLARLEMTIEDAFEPCHNLRGAARVLTEGYLKARRSGSQAQAAVRTALSYYNTGHPLRGLANGYVARVVRVSQATPIGVGWASEPLNSDLEDVVVTPPSEPGFVIHPQHSESRP